MNDTPLNGFKVFIILLALSLIVSACSVFVSGEPSAIVRGESEEDATSGLEATTGQENSENEVEGRDESMSSLDERILILTAGDTSMKAKMLENSTTDALIEKLKEGPVTIEMRDYASMEKVGELPWSLPRNDNQITAQAGDLILYQGSAFVIYYKPNAWNFTKIGKIEDMTGEEIKSVLGNGDVSVTINLDLDSNEVNQ